MRQRRFQGIRFWIQILIVLMAGLSLFGCKHLEPTTTTATSTQPNPTTTTSTPLISSTSPTLHLIIAADTSDPSIGALVEISANDFQKLFTNITTQSRNMLRLNPIILKGNRCTQKDIFSEIDQLTVKQNVDVIVFLYAGHGHRYQMTGTKWPLLDTRDQTTAFSLIISKIKSKQPRQYVVLADSCNNVVDISMVIPRSLAPYPYIKKLFIDPKIGIYASGCLPGQFSWGYDVFGTYFTQGFIRSLDLALKNGGEWQSIMENTREWVKDTVKTRHQHDQEPQFEIE